jgi:hypothetical protein
MALTSTKAVSVAKVTSSIGVNTHLDYTGAYANVAVTAAAINYLGVKNLRDTSDNPNTVGPTGSWQKIANATGAKFDDYMILGSPAMDVATLGYAKKLAAQHILNFMEGGNENDLPAAIAQGNSIAWTASFQKTVYAAGHAAGLPVINMSFGGGWTAANNWHGNYDKVGNLSAYADYANAHVYPTTIQLPDATIQRLNADAKLAAASRPVIETEIGWRTTTVSQANIARFTLDAVLDGIKDGDAKSYFYGLYDDASGKFGLMNSNGTARPAGTALHNLTTILADHGVARADALTYGLVGTKANDHALLMEKSTGTFQLAAWNEVDAAHNITLNLGAAAQTIRVYDPLTGVAAVKTYANASSVVVAVPTHPVIVEIVPKPVAIAAALPMVAAATTALPMVAATTAAPSIAPPTPQVIYGHDGASVHLQDGVNAVYLLGSHGSVVADAGTNTIFTNGSENLIAGGSGIDMIEAFAGSNILKAGSGIETIRFAGSNNTVYVGSGTDTLADSGSDNRIVLGKAGADAAQIFGAVLKNGDTLDLRIALASTTWTKDPATLGNFLKIATTGANTAISIDPTGAAAGATSLLAVLHGTGLLSLTTLMGHSTTA